MSSSETEGERSEMLGRAEKEGDEQGVSATGDAEAEAEDDLRGEKGSAEESI